MLIILSNSQLCLLLTRAPLPTGSGPLSSIARLPLKLSLPDPTAVSLPAQLSPLGKKPPLCGPIDLQASTGHAAAGTLAAETQLHNRCGEIHQLQCCTALAVIHAHVCHNNLCLLSWSQASAVTKTAAGSAHLRDDVGRSKCRCQRPHHMNSNAGARFLL